LLNFKIIRIYTQKGVHYFSKTVKMGVSDPL